MMRFPQAPYRCKNTLCQDATNNNVFCDGCCRMIKVGILLGAALTKLADVLFSMVPL